MIITVTWQPLQLRIARGKNHNTQKQHNQQMCQQQRAVNQYDQLQVQVL